jgi:hypothetical protein
MLYLRYPQNATLQAEYAAAYIAKKKQKKRAKLLQKLGEENKLPSGESGEVMSIGTVSDASSYFSQMSRLKQLESGENACETHVI